MIHTRNVACALILGLAGLALSVHPLEAAASNYRQAADKKRERELARQERAFAHKHDRTTLKLIVKVDCWLGERMDSNGAVFLKTDPDSSNAYKQVEDNVPLAKGKTYLLDYPLYLPSGGTVSGPMLLLNKSGSVKGQGFNFQLKPADAKGSRELFVPANQDPGVKVQGVGSLMSDGSPIKQVQDGKVCYTVEITN